MFKKGRGWQEVAGGTKSYPLPRNALSYKVVTGEQEVAGGSLSYVRKTGFMYYAYTYMYIVVGASKSLLPPAKRGISSLNDFVTARCAGRRVGIFGLKPSCQPPANPLPVAACRRRVPSVPVVGFSGLGSTGNGTSMIGRLGERRDTPDGRSCFRPLSRLLGRAERRHATAGASASPLVITAAVSVSAVGVAS